jgi:hypothetical protein
MAGETKQLITQIVNAGGAVTVYSSPLGGTAGTTTINYASALVSTPGIINNLRVNLDAAPGGVGKLWNITLYKNGSPTLLTVQIVNAATYGIITGTDVSVVAGDKLTLQFAPTNAPAAVNISTCLEFVPTTPGETLLLAYSGAPAQNAFASVIGGFSGATEFNYQLLIPCAGVIKNFYVEVNTAPGATTFIYTVRKNGVDQTLAVTLSGTAKTGNDTDVGHAITVAAGDKISIQRTGTSTATSIYLNTGMTFVPTVSGNFIIGDSSSTNVMTNSSTQYHPVSNFYNPWTTVENYVKEVFAAHTIKNMYVELSVAPDSGAGTQEFIFTLRKGGASQGLVTTISEAATTGNATADIAIADDDLLDTMKTRTGTPTASVRAMISYTGYIAPSADVITKTILSDAKIKIEDIQKTITSDAIISSPFSTIKSDAKIKVIDIQETILSDSLIVDRIQKTILSDAKIVWTGIQKTILSDAKICIPVLIDIINKFNFVKQALYDINNKVNTVKQVLSDINNFINTCKSIISDINNKINTKKLILNNVTNDIRFLYSWQRPVSGILQSLGKEYIKVYIGGILQTDIDVDSVDISKDLNSSHTATFELGRAYDATKPVMEATVEIKYNDWILFTGYVTQISPAETPEKIRINCQDEYWKQNKSNSYYNVGHKPTDDKELYYDTPKIALSTEHSWNLSIGNFVPQTINNFAVGKSDAITNLIEEAGNYGWFYDIDGTKKLWIAGDGSIVNIDRQILGANIELYDLISHTFTEDAENIVNKLRVQMGEKVIRKFDSTGGSRTYTGYNYSSYHQFLVPAWDESLELLSNQTLSGYGFDHPNPLYSKEYQEVFTKYEMPYLNPELSSWSDAFPPYIEMYNVGIAFGFDGLLNLSLEETITEDIQLIMKIEQ